MLAIKYLLDVRDLTARGGHVLNEDLAHHMRAKAEAEAEARSGAKTGMFAALGGFARRR